MAITRTPNKYKGFIFDGVDSRDYGIYITDGSVFGAPERDVEMIEIPGRNGAFALDKGRFNNIEVTYSVGLYFDNETDFATAVNSLRNELCSRKGYCRLEDDVNPDEYRMAVYKSGLEIDTNLRSSDFKIVFDCKPQRFLKSGETAVTVTSGGTLTNPTLFEAKPLIEAEGYGNIFINDGKLTVYNIPMGTISLPYSRVSLTDDSLTYTIGNLDLLENGDTIYFTGAELGDYPWFHINGGGTSFNPAYGHVTSTPYENNNIVSNGGAITYWIWSSGGGTDDLLRPLVRCILPTMTFTYGTQASTSYYCQYTVRANASADPAANPSYTTTVRETFTTNYDGAGEITILYGLSYGSQMTLDSRREYYHSHANEGVTANSTQSVNGTIYFDLDVAEAYIDQDGTITSANNIVEIPAVPPALESGSNVITYDNTITSLKVTPRWWEV